jgi:hypothetical protein
MLRYNSETSTFEGYSAGAWGAIITGTGVSSFSAGSTGFTPSSGTTGGIVLAGVLNASSGGSGVAGTLTGILYGNGATAYTVASTAQLLSGIGTVPIANGGTGQTTASAAFNALSPLTTTGDILYANATNSSTRLAIGSTGQILTVVGGLPAWSSLSSSAVTSFSGGSTGLTPASATTGAVSLAGTLSVSNGGTGLATNPANGQLLIGNGSNYTLATLTGGTGVTITNGSGSISISLSGTGSVTSFQTSLSGLTPSTATNGVVTLAGTLGATSGGTGYSLYTTGDMLYANTTTTLSKLAIGTLGYVMTSNGSAPTWTAVSSLGLVSTISFGTTGLTPSTATSGAVSVAGTLVVGNGGTGVATLTGLAYGNGTSAFTAATAAQVVTVIGSTAVTNATNATNATTAANLTLAAGSGATNYITFSATATGGVPQYTNTLLTYNYTNNAITGGIQGGGF